MERPVRMSRKKRLIPTAQQLGSRRVGQKPKRLLSDRHSCCRTWTSSCQAHHNKKTAAAKLPRPKPKPAAVAATDTRHSTCAASR